VPREMGILKVLPCNAEDSCGGTFEFFVCIAQCSRSLSGRECGVLGL
jgi:hypothetical protein